MARQVDVDNGNGSGDDNDRDEMEAVHRIGLFDAHCHPTDIMDSTGRIANMRARVLTVMSTRSQDQDLVAEVAKKYPIGGVEQLEESADNAAPAARYVVPAFGWHPWFSHQMYFDVVDDANDDDDDNDDHHLASDDERPLDPLQHYKHVLTPSPEDEHFLGTLLPPLSFSKYLKDTENRLRQFPLALVGEIGIDRCFRLPQGPSAMTGDVSQKTGGDKGSYTPGSREGRPLTPYKVSMAHQKKILRAQLLLAAKWQRPVSVHSVQAHGTVLEVLQGLWKGHMRPSKREQRQRQDAKNALITEEDARDSRSSQASPVPYPPRICMHSYSGPKETLQMFLNPKVPSDVFFSFSECINFGSAASKKAEEVIRAIPKDRILIESDLHCAGEVMDELLERIMHRICNIKSWTPEDAAETLRQNWERFVFGS